MMRRIVVILSALVTASAADLSKAAWTTTPLVTACYDGNTSTGGTFSTFGFIIDTGSSQAMSQLRWLPSASTTRQPATVYVSLSADGINFFQVATQSGYATDAAEKNISWPEVSARYVRATYTGADGRWACNEVYLANGVVAAGAPLPTLAGTLLSRTGWSTNSAQTTVSIDGDAITYDSSLQNGAIFGIKIDMQSPQTVNLVRWLGPAAVGGYTNNCQTSPTIQTSTDNTNWASPTMGAYTWDNTTSSHQVTFTAANVRYVWFTCTSGNGVGDLDLAEIYLGFVVLSRPASYPYIM